MFDIYFRILGIVVTAGVAEGPIPVVLSSHHAIQALVSPGLQIVK